MIDRIFKFPRGLRNFAHLLTYLNGIAYDEGFQIEVKPIKKRRSNDQNAYLWGVVYPTILKNLHGWDADDVHEYCLGEWSGWEVLEGFGRKRMHPIRRSSKLSTLEFMDYVAFIQRTMAERGIDIPDPHEQEHYSHAA